MIVFPNRFFMLLDAAIPPKGYFFVRETLPWILVAAILIIAAVLLFHTLKKRKRRQTAASSVKPQEDPAGKKAE